jgi:D-glycero-D-manno-heptose 1,7-bisphosphate phosphatase
MNSSDLSFTDNGTLFLDRDGVINRRIPGGYVSRWEEFEFLPGVLEALKILAGVFPRIILVSNQQGIGKGLMTMEELLEIDRRMKEEIRKAGGWIDASYYAPHRESDHHLDRKPAPGMAFRAKFDFPEIDFSRSIMAGDTASDMEFGRNLGMVTVCIGLEKIPADFYYISLLAFAQAIVPGSGFQVPK